jgi:hypothetical protein
MICASSDNPLLPLEPFGAVQTFQRVQPGPLTRDQC